MIKKIKLPVGKDINATKKIANKLIVIFNFTMFYSDGSKLFFIPFHYYYVSHKDYPKQSYNLIGVTKLKKGFHYKYDLF